jgi:hypothetical protein
MEHLDDLLAAGFGLGRLRSASTAVDAGGQVLGPRSS